MERGQPPPHRIGVVSTAMYTPEELSEALRSIVSTLHKCEKAIEKLSPGTPQHTLTRRRIEAFRIAIALIEREMEP